MVTYYNYILLLLFLDLVDEQDEEAGAACDPHERRVTGNAPAPRLAVEAPVEIVGPIGRSPVEMRVDRGRQCREHGGQQHTADPDR